MNKMSDAHTASLWNSALKSIQACEAHPFLVAMLDGTLPMAKFQFYILQGSVYLQDFAAALRLLASHSSANGDDREALLSLADETDRAERGLHTDFFEGWKESIQDPRSTVPSPTTLLYTSYFYRIILNRPYSEGLAVLLPCFWVYMHVGRIFAHRRGDINKKRPVEYDKWFDLYAGDEFEEHVVKYKNMVESAAAQTDEKERTIMQRHFNKACEMEWMFWNSALKMEQWPLFE